MTLTVEFWQNIFSMHTIDVLGVMASMGLLFGAMFIVLCGIIWLYSLVN